MHFGVIEINQEGVLSTKTGVVSRRGVYLDADEVWRDASSLDYIALIAVMPETIIHDVHLSAPLKGRNLETALAYELEALLPIPMEQIYWGYRRLSRSQAVYRLFAVRKTVAEKLLQKVAEANLSCDCVLPAQWYATPDTDPMELADNPAGPILKAFPRDPGAKNIILPVDVVPPELKPVRHRRWKRVYRLVLSLLVLVAVIVMFNRLDRFWNDYSLLRTYRKTLEADLRTAQETNRELLEGKEFAKKLSENKIGTAVIVPILTDLSTRLPQHMWLTNYSQNGDMIELSILSDKDDSSLSKILADSKLFSLVDFSKNTRPDNSATTFTVKLGSQLQ